MYVNEIGSEFDIDVTRIDKDAITVFDLLKDYETFFCDSINKNESPNCFYQLIKDIITKIWNIFVDI